LVPAWFQNRFLLGNEAAKSFKFWFIVWDCGSCVCVARKMYVGMDTKLLTAGVVYRSTLYTSLQFSQHCIVVYRSVNTLTIVYKKVNNNQH